MKNGVRKWLVLLILILVILGAICVFVVIRQNQALHKPNGETEQPEKPQLLFQGIPWGVTSKEAARILEGPDWSADTSVFEDHIKKLDNLADPYYEWDSRVGNRMFALNMRVEGYRIVDARLFFTYAKEDGKVNKDIDCFYGAECRFDHEDHETLYQDLRRKLTDRYGEGEEIVEDKSEMVIVNRDPRTYDYTVRKTVWHGGKGTFITLQWVTFDNPDDAVLYERGVFIGYGKKDAEYILEELKKLLTQ